MRGRAGQPGAPCAETRRRRVAACTAAVRRATLRARHAGAEGLAWNVLFLR
ncbi:hypothetical protein L493_2937 [Bordetella bronchiseptica 99-R-0433]|nr:hypothetical protein L493_2937 [Bordetella bronchiseptica 99-R-0433]